MTNFSPFIGEPLVFKEGFYVYPPKVRDVVANPKFNTYHSILAISQDSIEEELKKVGKTLETYPTPFEFLLANCYNSMEFRLLAMEAFEFFCKKHVIFDYENKQILLSNLTEETEYPLVLTEQEYFNFQNTIRESMGDKPIDPPAPLDPDEDPRVRAIKEKAKKRDRIKAKQGSKHGISLNTCLTAICCMGIGITPLNIGEMSYAAVGELMKMMQDKEKYDIDIRSLLAGADSKKIKPKYWIRNTNE